MATDGVHDRGADSPRRARLDAEDALLEALDAFRMRAHFQPVVRTTDGIVIGVEALARYEDGAGGIVGPTEFLEVAESTGLVRKVDTWILEQACRQAKRWQSTLLRRHPLRVSVNVSSRQLNRHDFVDVVRRALREASVNPDLIVLEVTERVLLESGDGVISRLHELREVGVGLAVDNFGTGWSSVARLKEYPVHQLKLDKSLVAGLGVDAKDSAIVAAVVQLGHALGLVTVAEGVETWAQKELLEAVGCDESQGFLFARPAPAEDLTYALTAPDGLPLVADVVP